MQAKHVRCMTHGKSSVNVNAQDYFCYYKQLCNGPTCVNASRGVIPGNRFLGQKEPSLFVLLTPWPLSNTAGEKTHSQAPAA